MTNLVNISYSIVCFVILLITPLSGEVFAQSGSDYEISTSSEDVQVVDNLDIGPEEKWYKSERIFGNIEIGDFVVGPGRNEIELSPGETVVKEVTVTNRITDDRKFRLEVEDIEGSSDGSRAVDLRGDEIGPYSIRDYISFPENEFMLELGERARIPVTITVPPDAEPGGYYGSVLVSTVRSSDSKEEALARSPIIARVGSLFFLRVKGDVVEEGHTQSISMIDDKMWYEEGPVSMGILYENKGSVHLNPYGQLSVKNMFGEEVGYVELEPWFVLPTSLRVREITWDREFLLGRYTVEAKINRGYGDIVDEVSVSFWVLPWKIVGGIFFILFIVIFGTRAFFRRFEFKRK